MTATHQDRERKLRNTPHPHSTRLHPERTALGGHPAQQVALLTTCHQGWGGASTGAEWAVCPASSGSRQWPHRLAHFPPTDWVVEQPRCVAPSQAPGGPWTPNPGPLVLPAPLRSPGQAVGPLGDSWEPSQREQVRPPGWPGPRQVLSQPSENWTPLGPPHVHSRGCPHCDPVPLPPPSPDGSQIRPPWDLGQGRPARALPGWAQSPHAPYRGAGAAGPLASAGQAEARSKPGSPESRSHGPLFKPLRAPAATGQAHPHEEKGHQDPGHQLSGRPGTVAGGARKSGV